MPVWPPIHTSTVYLFIHLSIHYLFFHPSSTRYLSITCIIHLERGQMQLCPQGVPSLLGEEWGRKVCPEPLVSPP